MTVEAQSGRFGPYGGRYVAETLMPALDELAAAYAEAQADPAFQTELDELLSQYAGRATPLYLAKRLSADVGFHVWLKREDLCHTGAHKVNNTIGQVLLAKRMGKTRIIAETGAGQHGVATATACALMGLPCEVYMGAEDIRRQAPNVRRMELLGAQVHPVRSGSHTLKDAMNEALRDWVTNVRTTHYCVGSAAGPDPYPRIVRDFQAVIGQEARAQALAQIGRLPDAVVACVGGGSNAIGIFSAFLDDRSERSEGGPRHIGTSEPGSEAGGAASARAGSERSEGGPRHNRVRLVGVEAAGFGVETGKHAAPLSAGSVGVLHGAKSYVLQNADGQIVEAHSISAGLDYPGVGPQHAWLKDTAGAEYVSVTDAEALEAFHLLCRREGIIPALESSHALAYLPKLAASLPKDAHVVVCLSGRGDKDLQTVLDEMGKG